MENKIINAEFVKDNLFKILQKNILPKRLKNFLSWDNQSYQCIRKMVIYKIMSMTSIARFLKKLKYLKSLKVN